MIEFLLSILLNLALCLWYERVVEKTSFMVHIEFILSFRSVSLLSWICIATWIHCPVFWHGITHVHVCRCKNSIPVVSNCDLVKTPCIINHNSNQSVIDITVMMNIILLWKLGYQFNFCHWSSGYFHVFIDNYNTLGLRWETVDAIQIELSRSHSFPTTSWTRLMSTLETWWYFARSRSTHRMKSSGQHESLAARNTWEQIGWPCIN